jgi:beta-N-acetylhexosaminidase
MIRAGEIAGVVLFADNVAGRADLRRTIAELQAIPRPDGLDEPLAVMTDQEGGQVKRVDGPPDASGAEMGARGTAYAEEQGRATARSLGSLGINVDLAPVLDVGRSGAAIVKEGRSFGSRPGTVISTAVDGFAAGLRDGGLVAAGKHFPGFGAAELNTDFAPQEIDVSRAELRRVDEAPFAAFADDGGELIMLSVASYSAFGGEPAALSRAIATRELRDRIGFGGVSITDSLDADAVTSFGSRSEVALEAAGAGSDLLLYGDWETAREAGRALTKALARGKLDRDDFAAAAQRVLSLRAELAG